VNFNHIPKFEILECDRWGGQTARSQSTSLRLASSAAQARGGHKETPWPSYRRQAARRRDLTGGWWTMAPRSIATVDGDKHELQNHAAKRTVRPWAFSERKESWDGGQNLLLTGGVQQRQKLWVVEQKEEMKMCFGAVHGAFYSWRGRVLPLNFAQADP
jgi:hypothetical protein